MIKLLICYGMIGESICASLLVPGLPLYTLCFSWQIATSSREVAYPLETEEPQLKICGTAQSHSGKNKHPSKKYSSPDCCLKCSCPLNKIFLVCFITHQNIELYCALPLYPLCSRFMNSNVRRIFSEMKWIFYMSKELTYLGYI
ncbi:hypothetical protein FKM82_013573 [Ascaphus truei]